MMIKAFRSILSPFRKKPSGLDDFLKEVSGIIHIGANTGQERNLYAKYDLKVAWVEPIPEIFRQLQKNTEEFTKQKAINALVTDVDDKEYEFHISNNCGESSSILDLHLHRDIWPEVNYSTTIRLKSTTLPSLLKVHQLNERDYQALIMDTQGSELLVLKGSIPILKSFLFIKTEVPDFEAYTGCCQLKVMNSFMSQHGYKEYRRSRFARRAQGGSYYNIVYKARRFTS
jgi:FkbM family methyltransferase